MSNKKFKESCSTNTGDIKLSEQDAAAFAACMANPKAPNENLKKAFADYKKNKDSIQIIECAPNVH